MNILSTIDTNNDKTQIVCLVPIKTRALRIGKIIEQMAKFMTVQYSIFVKNQNNVPSQIIIGKMKYVYNEIVKSELLTANIKLFVIDDADNLKNNSWSYYQSIFG